MTQLVANVLDMTRLESGQMALRREWVVLEEVIGSALRRLAGPLAGYRVSTHLTDAPDFVRADPVLLEQLLFNLLDNAVRHTPAAPTCRSTCGGFPMPSS